MMKWNLVSIGLLVLTITMSRGALAAPILSFDNAEADIQKTHQVGETILMDLWISGLDPSAGDALGGFDLETSYDGAVTDYQSTEFGEALNDYQFFALEADELGQNAVNHSGVSLSFDLSDQISAFKLFTIEFTAAQLGESVLALDRVLLSDAFGFELEAQTYSATIRVQGATEVPEPDTLALMLLGLVALIRRRPRLCAIKSTAT